MNDLITEEELKILKEKGEKEYKEFMSNLEEFKKDYTLSTGSTIIAQVFHKSI